MARPAFRIRHLQAFLAKVDSSLPKDESGLSGCLFFAAPIAAFVIAKSMKGGALFWLFLLSFLGVALCWWMMESYLKDKRTAKLVWRKETAKALTDLREYNENDSLDERLDPEVGALLDRCAAVYLEIENILDRPEWRNAEGHRQSAQTSVQAALTSLMGDAIDVSCTGLRRKGQRRDVFGKRMADPAIREPMLKALGQMLEGMESLSRELGNIPASNVSDTDLRTAIEKLAEIRLAEEELHQSLKD